MYSYPFSHEGVCGPTFPFLESQSSRPGPKSAHSHLLLPACTIRPITLPFPPTPPTPRHHTCGEESCCMRALERKKWKRTAQGQWGHAAKGEEGS